MCTNAGGRLPPSNFLFNYIFYEFSAMRAPGQQLGWETRYGISHTSEFIAEIHSSVGATPRDSGAEGPERGQVLTCTEHGFVSAASKQLLLPRPP